MEAIRRDSSSVSRDVGGMRSVALRRRAERNGFESKLGGADDGENDRAEWDRGGNGVILETSGF